MRIQQLPRVEIGRHLILFVISPSVWNQEPKESREHFKLHPLIADLLEDAFVSYLVHAPETITAAVGITTTEGARK